MSFIGSTGVRSFQAAFAVMAVSAASLAARAEDNEVAAASCAPALPNEALDASDLGPDLLEPEVRGVDLEDLGLPEATMVAGFLRLKGSVDVREILSLSAVARHPRAWVVDVLGRAERFVDHDDQRSPRGRVGVVRVVVPIAADGRCDVGAPEVRSETSLADLDLHYRVSIADWVAVIEDPKSGFRRLYPLGGGGIDRGVRIAGFLTSLTPTTEDALLEKTYAWRELHSPWYFRNKPYLPLSVARTYVGPDGVLRKYYGEAKIAFHIWQDKGFQRGFFSHGCMRMRTADLAELAAFVFGVDKPIPAVVRIASFRDVRHPYPMETKVYWQLKNYGSAEKPKTRLKYMLYETELGTAPLPPLTELQALTFGEKPVVLDAIKTAKAIVLGTFASRPAVR